MERSSRVWLSDCFSCASNSVSTSLELSWYSSSSSRASSPLKTEIKEGTMKERSFNEENLREATVLNGIE